MKTLFKENIRTAERICNISGAGVILAISMVLGVSLPVSGQHSLYRDVKAQQIGDIITVVLMENISGSSTSDSRRSSSTSGQASGSASGNFLPFEPYFGTNASVDYGDDALNRANQKQLLEGYMSVQITDITERGDLIVMGNRLTEINGEKHEISLYGTIRSNDVDGRNRVPSYRVANAEISYQQIGGLKQSTRRSGFVRRLVFYGVGAAMGAAILVRELR